ncbi:MAG: hypothetical protein P1U62_13815 [Alteraurantiacibacter sp. bin_em_oilr2.035]|nr:hypothetical protein [Alteraurantiacibacter sp. bin_em_oilr2.035]
MTAIPPFDFRNLLGSKSIDPVDPGEVERLVVGVAANEPGLALVALRDGKLLGKNLDAYAHVVIGPIEDDWETIAGFIDEVRELLEPPIIGNVLLRMEDGSSVGNAARIYERLKKTFPSELLTVGGDEVAKWTKASPCKIALPDIPEEDIWTRQLLAGAAETAVFAENGPFLSRRQDAAPRARRSAQTTVPAVTASADSSCEKACAATVNDLELRNSYSATAINFTNPYLYIATVRSDLDGKFILEDDRTAIFKLEGRSSESLRKMQQELRDVFARWEVNSIALRVGADTGPYVFNPNAYRLEAALQLLDDLQLSELTVPEISGFARKFDHLLPEPQEHLTRQAQRNGQKHAIRAAGLHLNRIERNS